MSGNTSLGSKLWGFLAVPQFLQKKKSTQLLVLGHDILQSFVLIFLLFDSCVSQKFGTSLKRCNEIHYNVYPINRAAIRRPTPTGLCYVLQHWSRDRSMWHTPDCVEHKMGFNITPEFCVLCSGRIMKGLSVRHADKTVTKYWDAISLMLRRHAGLIIKFELKATVWFGSAAYLGAKMTHATSKAKKMSKDNIVWQRLRSGRKSCRFHWIGWR